MMKKLIKIFFILLIIFLGGVVFMLTFLTVTEYQPKKKEKVKINGSSQNVIKRGDSISVLSWNIGYGSLGNYADFFMDGGSMVSTSTKNQVKENMASIVKELVKQQSDITLLQEVDVSSKRSYDIDEIAYIQNKLKGQESSFAYNYKVEYVPYPIPTIGKVAGGIATFSKYDMESSTRIKLPCPFSYPTRVANLKRCLMVNRMKIKDSRKELVVVNLHLEAYDSGKGKEKQTKVLKQLLESEQIKGNYVIAGGDFNQTFSNVDTSSYPVLSEDMWEAGKIDVSDFSKSLSFYMDETVPTCRSLDQPLNQTDKRKNQYYMIDGFIVSSNIKVKQIKTLDLAFEHSDHNPVRMEVILE